MFHIIKCVYIYACLHTYISTAEINSFHMLFHSTIWSRSVYLYLFVCHLDNMSLLLYYNKIMFYSLCRSKDSHHNYCKIFKYKNQHTYYKIVINTQCLLVVYDEIIVSCSIWILNIVMFFSLVYIFFNMVCNYQVDINGIIPGSQLVPFWYDNEHY